MEGDCEESGVFGAQAVHRAVAVRTLLPIVEGCFDRNPDVHGSPLFKEFTLASARATARTPMFCPLALQMRPKSRRFGVDTTMRKATRRDRKQGHDHTDEIGGCNQHVTLSKAGKLCLRMIQQWGADQGRRTHMRRLQSPLSETGLNLVVIGDIHQWCWRTYTPIMLGLITSANLSGFGNFRATPVIQRYTVLQIQMKNPSL